MSPALFERWRIALRDPKYGENTAPLLRSSRGFSPLGVLWDVCGGEWTLTPDGAFGVRCDDGLWCVLMPVGEAKRIGLEWKLVIALEKVTAPLPEVADILLRIGILGGDHG